MKNIIQNVLLLSASVIVALLLGEVLASFVLPQDLSGSWRRQTESGLTVNKSTGFARHQYNERVVYYEFTNNHIRGQVQDSKLNVLILGDSFTFGWLLAHEDSIVHLLQEHVNEEFGASTFALHNAAAGGWGTGDYVAFVEEIGKNIEPDIILVFLNTDDIGRATRSPLWDFNPSEESLERIQAPRSRLKETLNNLPVYDFLLENSHLTQIIRLVMIGQTIPSTQNQQPQTEIESNDATNLSEIELLNASGPRTLLNTPEEMAFSQALGKELFIRLVEWSKNYNAKLVVTTTGWHQPPYHIDQEPTEAFMATADTFFESLDVPFFDPSLTIWATRRQNPSHYSIAADYHPNEAGAALIADANRDFLISVLHEYCHTSDHCD